MMSAESFPNTNTTLRPPRGKWRWLLTRRGRVLCVGLLLALAGCLYWYNEHRTIEWRDFVNPGYWIDRWNGDDLYLPEKAVLKHGNRELREVALTFDDGPHRTSRGKILDILKQYGARATFFDVGIRMAESPEMIHRTLAEGHEVANHTYRHRRLPTLSPPERHKEINDTDITFYRITGRHLTYLRPPGMRHTPDVLRVTKRMGYIVVDYNTASLDFVPQENPSFIANRTLRRTENGSIILLHDYPHTAIALPFILEELQRRGYRFVTISEMIDHLPEKARLAAHQFQQSEEIASSPLPSAPATVPTSRAVGTR